MFGKRKSSNPRDRADSPYGEPGRELPEGTVSRPVTQAPPRASSDTHRPAPSAMAEQPRRSTDSVPPRRADTRPPVDTAAHEGRKLVVGRDISLAGEIKSCEKLVVEGQVEAHLDECRVLQVSQSGIYKGAAAVEHAEISGIFEGDLIVQDRLVLRSTGRIYGRLHYVEMEIERGGRIIGELAQLEIEPPKAVAPPPPEAPAPPAPAVEAPKPAPRPAPKPRASQDDKRLPLDEKKA